MVLVTILVLPLFGGAAIAAVPGRRSTAWVAVATNGAALVLGILTAVRVVRDGPLVGAWGALRADALSVFMVIVIGAISLMASWVGIRTMAREQAEEHGQPGAVVALRRARPGLRGLHAPRRAGGERRRALGGRRGHDDRHRLPGRAPADQGARSRLRGSTS